MKFIGNVFIKLYGDVGEKIKALTFFIAALFSCFALIGGVIAAIASIIIGFVTMITTETFLSLLICIIYAVLIVVFSLAFCLIICLLSIFPYGFGQLVENSQKLVDIASRNDAEKKRDEEKLADLEAEKKARLATLEKARREVDEKKVQTEAENIARIEKEQNDIKAKAEAKALQAEGRKIIEDEKRKEKEAAMWEEIKEKEAALREKRKENEAALWEKNHTSWEAANEKARKIREEMDAQGK